MELFHIKIKNGRRCVKASSSRPFEGSQWLHPQYQAIPEGTTTLRIVRNCTPTHRPIPQDFNPEQHRCENLKSCTGHLFIVCSIMNPLQPVVTICTAQWSLYVPHSSHYMYRTVITICTAQWSLYVPPSGHYMYRTVVTICTAQWSLSVLHSGHYMYHPVVTICSTQWSLYVPPV